MTAAAAISTAAAALFFSAAGFAFVIGVRDAMTARVRIEECAALMVLSGGAAALSGGWPAVGGSLFGLGVALAALASVALILEGILRRRVCARGDWWAMGAIGWAAGWPEISPVILVGGVLGLIGITWYRVRRVRKRGARRFWLARAPMLPGFGFAAAAVLGVETWTQFRLAAGMPA